MCEGGPEVEEFNESFAKSIWVSSHNVAEDNHGHFESVISDLDINDNDLSLID